MEVTSNTSPLIALAKIGRLKLLTKLYGKIIISPFVELESVDKGKELGAPDALEIEKAIDEGWIKVAQPTKKQDEQTERLIGEMKIGLGEAGALILARNLKLTVILDDKEARAIAKSWGLEHMGTVMVLYEAFIAELISYDELVDDYAKLARVMWISTDVIIELIRNAGKVRK